MSTETVRTALEKALGLASGAPATVDRLWPLAGGASMETWAVDAVVAGAPEALVVRKDMAVNMHASALSRRDEFALLAAAHAAGVPCPRPRWVLEMGDRPAREAFAMDRCPGESVGRRVVRMPELSDARRVLAGQLGEALAKIHMVPLTEALAFLPRPTRGQTPAEACLLELRDAMAALKRDNPVWAYGYRWLQGHRPAPTGDLTLVHGDFRVGNLLVLPTGLGTVIDWEFSHVGDPAEDLAWCTVRDWRFEKDALEVGGVGTRAQLHEGYHRAGGREVDDATLRWWEVAGNLRWAVVCHAQCQRHLGGRDRSVELASLGRKAAEMEWELLALIEKENDR
ncbi:MAG: phosphotransferase family protein [Deltaproteobacteria bacterium]|nr:phosphotransferase family protein [Deltaproteobacteria bacterium]